MRNQISVRVFLILFSTLLFAATGTPAAENPGSRDLLLLVLDMFRYDQYLPAIDLLEQNSDANQTNFNYWLYRGLGYQRTEQTKKSLQAYERAAALSPSAANLQNRIRALHLEVEQKNFQEISLDTPVQKAEWLMRQAEKMRNARKEDLSLKYFLQAVAYNSELIDKNKDFISRGEIYYRLKLADKAQYAELFHGIFKYLQNDLPAAESDLQAFMKTASRPPALERLAGKYLTLIEENRPQETVSTQNTASVSAAPADSENPQPVKPIVEIKPEKTDIVTIPDQVEIIESSISDSRSPGDDESFVVRYAAETAKSMLAGLERAEDVQPRCRLIWELGETSLQNPEIMQALAGELANEDPRVVRTACEAIAKIGMPAAGAAVTPLLEILKTDDKAMQFNAIELLGKLKAMPERVIPALVSCYAKEDDIYLKRNIYYWVNKYDRSGVQVLYKVLDNTARGDRKPVAELISRITGEKMQELIDR